MYNILEKIHIQKNKNLAISSTNKIQAIEAYGLSLEKQKELQFKDTESSSTNSSKKSFFLLSNSKFSSFVQIYIKFITNKIVATCTTFVWILFLTLCCQVSFKDNCS